MLLVSLQAVCLVRAMAAVLVSANFVYFWQMFISCCIIGKLLQLLSIALCSGMSLLELLLCILDFHLDVNGIHEVIDARFKLKFNEGIKRDDLAEC